MGRRITANSAMYARLTSGGLQDIADKLDAGVRLDPDDGLRLFECPDLLAVGWLANREREKRYGNQTFFNHNIRLEATNVCVASCLFCFVKLYKARFAFLLQSSHRNFFNYKARFASFLNYKARFASFF